MITSTIQADLACPVERVWAVLTDLTCQDWRSDIERVEITGRIPLWSIPRVGLPLALR